MGWTPDSKNVLFHSPREAYADFDRLYTVPVEGGWPEVLPMWRAEDGMVFAGRKAHRLRAEPEMADLVEALQRRADHADLHRAIERFEAGESAAREFERFASGVVWRHGVFSVGPQRRGHACLPMTRRPKP